MCHLNMDRNEMFLLIAGKEMYGKHKLIYVKNISYEIASFTVIECLRCHKKILKWKV